MALLRRTPKISHSELTSRIQKKAYDIYQKRGYSNGKDWSDWFEAERKVKSELGIR